jgi:tetratricopeptide (TPR) repeat protein
MRQRRYVSRTLIAALSCALGLVLAAPADAQTGRVGGIVKDEAGQTIKGATITAENSNIGQSFTATTDDKGRFIMIGLRTGQWRFIAQAPGFSPQAGELPVRMGAPNPPMTFELKRSGVAQFGALAGITAKDLQSDLGAADALFNQKRWDDAVVAYRAVMAKAPALSVINLQIAAAYRNKKDYDAAIAAYTDLLKLDPENEKAKVGIGLTNLERGNTQAAEATLLKAAESPTAGREVFYNLGEVKFTNGDTDEAIKWYEKARAADPAWGKPLYKLALCAIKKGDTAAAAKLMDRVIAVDPVSPEAALARTTLDSLNK